MATHHRDLYGQDYYAWAQDQADALCRLAKEPCNGPLDLAHPFEEVEGSGNEVRSHIRSLIEHCLELEHAKAMSTAPAESPPSPTRRDRRPPHGDTTPRGRSKPAAPRCLDPPQGGARPRQARRAASGRRFAA